MKLFQIKMFTRKFPERHPRDTVVSTVDNLKAAQTISMELNAKYADRYYVQEIYKEIN